MKYKISSSIIFSLLLLAACSHKPSPVKIGDEHIDVPPVTKARSEIIPPYAQKAPTQKVPLDIKKCTCVQLWMPVCGENGKTYSNSCFAECAGVKYKPGSCKKDITD